MSSFHSANQSRPRCRGSFVVICLALTSVVRAAQLHGDLVFDRGGIMLMDLSTRHVRMFSALGDGDPAWSPDGSQIVYSHRIDDHRWDLLLMDRDGANRRRLTSHPSMNRFPSWSPDGKRITFVSNRDGLGSTAWDVFVMEADGSNVRNLTRDSPIDTEPDWSPDGSRIAFRSRRDRFGGGDRVSEIYTMDPDGSDQRRLTVRDAFDGEPAWSPDGSEILILRSRDLRDTPYAERRGGRAFYIMDADGGNVREIAHFARAFRGGTWSPDGAHIAFSLSIPREDGRGDNFEIFVMDRDGSHVRNLTNHPDGGMSPDWFDPRYSTAFTPAYRALFQWGWLKQVGRAQ